MSSYLGIIFALIALVCWGFGDFFTQRSARKFGDWESLFVISLIGSILLLPFVLNDISSLVKFSFSGVGILLLVALIFFTNALINIEALKRGKLAVIESIGAAEVIIAGLLSYFVFGERLDYYNWVFVALLVFGILLVALKPHHFRRETWLEKGALLAFSGAIIMGLTDFMVALGARTTNPIFTVWFFNIVIFTISLLYLKITGRFRHFLKDFTLHKNLMGGIGILENIAWLSFAASMTFIPVVVALALSESYIILATILGLVVNREKLQNYQFVGIIVSIICVIVLSIFYS